MSDIKADEEEIHAKYLEVLLESGKIGSEDLMLILDKVRKQLEPIGNNEIISHNFLSYNPPKELEDLHDILTSNKISFTVNLSDKEGEVLFITDLGYDDNISKLIWLVPTWLGDIINSKCGKAIIATCIIHDGKCNYSDMYG